MLASGSIIAAIKSGYHSNSQNIEKLNDLGENTSEIEWLNLKLILKL